MEVIGLAISFRRLMTLLKTNGYTTYRIRKENMVGRETWRKLQTDGHIDTRTINKLCAMLNCQPGDIMEYVPDDPSP
jgi:putative transcriptional regulator